MALAIDQDLDSVDLGNFPILKPVPDDVEFVVPADPSWLPMSGTFT